jgi:hypothetical protein
MELRAIREICSSVTRAASTGSASFNCFVITSNVNWPLPIFSERFFTILHTWGSLPGENAAGIRDEFRV